MKAYIHEQVRRLCRRHGTRDPFELLDAMHVIVLLSDRYRSLKGYTFMSCRSVYVVINSALSDTERRIVAAHELGHVVLHKRQLKCAPMSDAQLYDMTAETEYEANLFAADLLISDEEIEKLTSEQELDYFSLCSSLYVSPELMSFKLFSLVQRGHPYNMPMVPDSDHVFRNPNR